jgi:DNA-binding NtrC family response regulator
VLLQGESGTGKDLIARLIHKSSPRHEQPYLAINCGAISPQLIGSELFGHERGSFTGAHRQHKGYFEQASGGTLFLDEITEMPLELQVQLLRVLEEGTLVRIGGDRPIVVDVRLIAATNRDPGQAIRDGKLREDLYFRLSVFPIQVPALRERGADDIARLAKHFLNTLNHRYGTDKRLTPAALRWLEQNDWPGNVRQLGNAVQRGFILAEAEIDTAHLTGFAPFNSFEPDDPLQLRVGTPIEVAERRLILTTLDHYRGDKPRTAEVLGISLKTLYNRLKQYQEKGPQ